MWTRVSSPCGQRTNGIPASPAGDTRPVERLSGYQSVCIRKDMLSRVLGIEGCVVVLSQIYIFRFWPPSNCSTWNSRKVSATTSAGALGETATPAGKSAHRVTLVTCVTSGPSPILEEQALPLCALKIE
jgi:hypothetical protein